MLNAWLVQQEQKGDAAVRQQVSDARKRLEEDRSRWVNDVTASISRLADLDATLLRGPSPNSPAWSNQELNAFTAESSDRAASSWAGIQARHDLDYGLPLAQREHGGEAADGGTAAVPQPNLGAAEADNGAATHPQPDSEAAAAAEIESLAAEIRCARLEAVAGLARQGLAAHWRAFFRDEVERTRFAATALDLTASRWAQRQRRAVGALRASWRGRDWQSTARSRGGGGGGDSGDGGTGSVVGISAPGSGKEGQGGAVVNTGAASTPAGGSATSTDPAMQGKTGKVDGADTVATARPKTQARGADTFCARGEGAQLVIGAGVSVDNAAFEVEGAANGEGGGRQDESAPPETEPDIQRLGEGGSENTSACSTVVRNAVECSSGGVQPTPPDVEATEGAAEAGQLVLFVGRAMAFHTPTVRTSHLEKFHQENRHRRCSSISAPPRQGQQDQR